MEEEAKEYLIKKMKECCLFISKEHPDIYYIYDKQIIRQKKLLRLAGKRDYIIFKPNNNSLFLFKCDNTHKYFWYSYKHIYKVLIKQYNITEEQIYNILKSILRENIHMKNLTPQIGFKTVDVDTLIRL